jgi:hypothetical protein
MRIRTVLWPYSVFFCPLARTRSQHTSSEAKGPGGGSNTGSGR